MTIDGTQFGSITVDGRVYDHDVVVRLAGDVVKRNKQLSKAQYGTSHIISRAEIERAYEDGCDELFVGTGQYGRASLSEEALAFLADRQCAVHALQTPDALRRFNESGANKVGLFHVTC